MPISILGLNRSHDGETIRHDAHFSSIEDIALAEPFDVSVLVTKLRHDLYDAHIIGTAQIEVDCHRCLKQFTHPVSLDFHATFADEPSEDDWPIEKNDIDVEEPIRQEILFLLPAQIICSPDCKGIEIQH
jgi:uncharacterized protein